MVYPSATHGWDQRRSANFYEGIACKGRGCFNINAPDAQVAQQSIKDLIEFLGAAMPGLRRVRKDKANVGRMLLEKALCAPDRVMFLRSQ